jgi:preprotein translocase subunit SecG
MKFSAHIELSGVMVLEPMILNEPASIVLVTVDVAVVVCVAVVVTVLLQPAKTTATVRTSARGKSHFLIDLNNFFSFLFFIFF